MTQHNRGTAERIFLGINHCVVFIDGRDHNFRRYFDEFGEFFNRVCFEQGAVFQSTMVHLVVILVVLIESVCIAYRVDRLIGLSQSGVTNYVTASIFGNISLAFLVEEDGVFDSLENISGVFVAGSSPRNALDVIQTNG